MRVKRDKTDYNTMILEHGYHIFGMEAEKAHKLDMKRSTELSDAYEIMGLPSPAPVLSPYKLIIGKRSEFMYYDPDWVPRWLEFQEKWINNDDDAIKAYVEKRMKELFKDE